MATRIVPYGANFNSHARVGRDIGIGADPGIGGDFNSHARVGRDADRFRPAGMGGNFNSHARVGRDPILLLGLPNVKISTHTPV